MLIFKKWNLRCVKDLLVHGARGRGKDRWPCRYSLIQHFNDYDGGHCDVPDTLRTAAQQRDSFSVQAHLLLFRSVSLRSSRSNMYDTLTSTRNHSTLFQTGQTKCTIWMMTHSHSTLAWACQFVWQLVAHQGSERTGVGEGNTRIECRMRIESVTDDFNR